MQYLVEAQMELMPGVRSWQASTSSVASRSVDEALVDLGEGVTRVLCKQYAAYQRLRNFACVCQSQQTKFLLCFKADPKEVDLVAGFTRDMTGSKSEFSPISPAWKRF